MSSPPPPDVPPPLPGKSDQWAFPTDEKGEPKKNYVLWIVIGAAGCFVSIVVLGLAATLVVPRIVRNLQNARGTAARAELFELRERLEAYAIEHDGRYPDSLAALDLPESPRDPWGRPFVYEPPTPERREPLIYTLGKDGLPGGSGEDADIHVGPDPAAGR